MSGRILNKEQIIDIIWGTTLMAAGGGGSMSQALKLLETFEAAHPEQPVELQLYDVEELDPAAYAAVISGIGAPTAGKRTDITSQIVGAYAGLQEMTAAMQPPVQVQYVLAIELGGANTFIPMLVSLMYGLPFVDADGAGRACPAMNTMLLSINGCAVSPVVMSDSQDNRVIIQTKDPKDAARLEQVARSVCTAFGMTSVMGGSLLRQAEIQHSLPVGTITQSEKIGRIMRQCAGTQQEVFAALAAAGVLDCQYLCSGTVLSAENQLEHGFDYGRFQLEAEDGQCWTIGFQNESLVLRQGEQVVMTVPDLICTYDRETGLPVTNADLTVGMKLTIGIAKADEKWWQNPGMFEIWQPFLHRVGYEGENVPYTRGVKHYGG